MSVIVRLYTFAKRDNSTKLPTSEPVEYTCILKEECGVINNAICVYVTDILNYIIRKTDMIYLST